MPTEPTTLDTSAGAVDAIAALAPKPQLIELPSVVERHAVLVTPNGVRVEHIDLQAYEDQPARPANTVRPATVAALRAYAKRYYCSDLTTVWVDADTLTITAILNDHSGDVDPDVNGAGWRDHRAVLKLTTTPEWKHWTKLDQQLVSQVDFAQHIEDGYAEIVKPDAATMLEIAQSIDASSSGTFKSRQRLKDGGVEFVYDDQVTATAGGTRKLEIPDTFELLLSPLVGEDPVAMTARLRFRISAGKLVLGYRLDRPHQVLSDACDLIVETLRGDFEHVYLGRPE